MRIDVLLALVRTTALNLVTLVVAGTISSVRPMVAVIVRMVTMMLDTVLMLLIQIQFNATVNMSATESVLIARLSAMMIAELS